MMTRHRTLRSQGQALLFLRLRSFSKDGDLSQTEAASLVDTSQQHIGRLAFGDCRPEFALRCAFNDKFKIPLVAWDDPPARDLVEKVRKNARRNTLALSRAARSAA